MTDRYWEHNTPRRHIYIDGDTGRIIGTLVARLTDKVLEAHAYDRKVGEYRDAEKARWAVEAACVEVEEIIKLRAATAQADGSANDDA